MFEPRMYSPKEKEELIHLCIEGVISPDADEGEVRWWCSAIPETLRHILWKQKVISRRLEDIDNDLARLDAKFRLAYIHKGGLSGSITERKDFADAMKLGRSSEYRNLVKERAKLNELWAGYEADKVNVMEKSFMIRKIANFEADRVQYDE